jgi:ABC-type spermidine/putrescine transport system permease subunit II
MGEQNAPDPSTAGSRLLRLFVLFLYGPMIAIFILSFQGPTAA